MAENAYATGFLPTNNYTLSKMNKVKSSASLAPALIPTWNGFAADPIPTTSISSPVFGSSVAPLGKMSAPKLGIAGTDISNAWGLSDSASTSLPYSNKLAIDAPKLSDPTMLPDIGGDWLEGGKFGLDVAKVGLGIYNALEQSKMNKFMKGYYGDQMALQKADFSNNAKSVNASLEQRAQNKASAAGFTFGSDENKKRTDAEMAKWGMKETV